MRTVLLEDAYGTSVIVNGRSILRSFILPIYVDVPITRIGGDDLFVNRLFVMWLFGLIYVNRYCFIRG